MKVTFCVHDGINVMEFSTDNINILTREEKLKIYKKF